MLGDARGAFVASLFFTFFAAMFTDFIVATWREAPMVLGPLELMGVGGVGALAMVGAREIRQRSLVAGGPDPRQLAAAVDHELAVAEQRRAKVERLRWTHAILSITSHGAHMSATNIDVADETFEGLDPCEILDRVKLPVGLAAALPSAAMGYRT